MKAEAYIEIAGIRKPLERYGGHLSCDTIRFDARCINDKPFMGFVEFGELYEVEAIPTCTWEYKIRRKDDHQIVFGINGNILAEHFIKEDSV